MNRNRRSAAFGACVNYPPHWLVLVVVLVLALDFKRVFQEDDEDENEEDGTFWCFSHRLFMPLQRRSAHPSVKRRNFRIG